MSKRSAVKLLSLGFSLSNERSCVFQNKHGQLACRRRPLHVHDVLAPVPAQVAPAVGLNFYFYELVRREMMRGHYSPRSRHAPDGVVQSGPQCLEVDVLTYESV